MTKLTETDYQEKIKVCYMHMGIHIGVKIPKTARQHWASKTILYEGELGEEMDY